MNQVTGIIKMHFRDKWIWLFVPALVLISNFMFSFFLSLLLQGQERFYNGGLLSIYIYMLITGIITLPQTFSFSLSLSARRSDYFLGTASTATLVSAAMAVLMLVLSVMERLLGGWGDRFHFFYLPYLSDGTLIERLGTDFVLMVHMYFFGFTISSLHRRFGRNGMFVFSIVAFFLLSICVYIGIHSGWWQDIWYWLSNHTAFELAIRTIPMVVFYILVSYLLLRKAPLL